ncbi:MAG: transporter substrate-binding domain-containing protein [Candidatus Aminicenantes bacterium]|nr:transporter substrate-binding domain-containing protein [Candidatus Aminicenantes bacterium]
MKKKFWVFALFLGYACSLLFGEIPRKIIVGLGDPYPPFTFVEGNQRPTGICPEIIDAAAKIVGIEVEYKQLLWARLTQEVRNGKIDAVIALFKTLDRIKYFEFLDNDLLYEENSLFKLSSSGIKYSGQLKDLEKITVGVVQDYKYGGDFDQADFLKKEKCLTDQNLVEKLIKKRFDIAIGNNHVINYYAKKLKIQDEIQCLQPPVFTGFSHVIAFPKSKEKFSNEMAQKFSDAINQLKENGTYKKILDKYKFVNKEYSIELAYNDWSPYYGPDMPNQGPIAEIIREAFKWVGYSTKIEFLPWANLMEKLKTGRCDAGFAAYYSEQRAKDYIYSDPIGICSRVAFLKKQDLQINYKKLEDLKLYRIGVTRGYIYAVPEFDNADYLNKIESTSEEASIMNLLKKRLDLVIIDKAVAQYLLKKKFMTNKNELDFLEFTDRKGELFLFISKTNKEADRIKKDFDYGLKQIKEDGTFDRIIKEYEKKYGYSYATDKN